MQRGRSGQLVRCCRFFQRSRTVPSPASQSCLPPRSPPRRPHAPPACLIERASTRGRASASTHELVHGSHRAALSADEPREDLGNVTRLRANCEGSQAIRDWMGHIHQVVSPYACAQQRAPRSTSRSARPRCPCSQSCTADLRPGRYEPRWPCFWPMELAALPDILPV